MSAEFTISKENLDVYLKELGLEMKAKDIPIEFSNEYQNEIIGETKEEIIKRAREKEEAEKQ